MDLVERMQALVAGKKIRRSTWPRNIYVWLRRKRHLDRLVDNNGREAYAWAAEGLIRENDWEEMR